MPTPPPPEEFSSFFFELSLDLFCIAGVDGYFRYINQAWEQTLGYSKKTLLEKSFLDLIHIDDLKATVDELEKLDAGKKTLNYENRFLASNGDWVWLSWKATPQPDGTIYAVARNVTEQKQNQLATKKLLEQLQLSNRELDQFAYIVSHDLKSPLRGINSLAEWIAEDLGPDLPEEVQGHLKMLKQRVDLMQRLINDLLLYARTGRQKEIAEALDLNEIIDEVLSNIHTPAAFTVEVQDKLPPINGAKTEFLQIFFNLISNSIKYRSSDSGRISIGGKTEDDSTQIWVTDDGIGIEPRYHDKIFEVFQRLDLAENIEGTGIGLAIVKKVVEGQGGNIAVTSDLGKGAKFLLSFPSNNNDWEINTHR